MTNGDRIRKMSDEELADFLCNQLWEDYHTNRKLTMIRYNQVRNFLKMEAEDDEGE